MPEKRIFKKELAVQLIRKGHDLIDAERNKNNPSKTVFVFNETEQLLKDLTELTK
jgi:hypothetical protein